MKPGQTLLILALFFLVLGAHFYFNETSKPPETDSEFGSFNLLPLEQKDEIVWLQIQNLDKQEIVTLEKKSFGWRITEPLRADADDFLAEGFVTALRLSGKAKRFVQEKPWEEYGLAQPALKVGVGSRYQKEHRILSFGDPSPMSPHVYARWDDEKEYFLVDENLKKIFDRSLYSLRQKRVFRIPPHKINKIHVTTFTRDYEWIKKEGKWFWVEPIRILGEQVPKEAADQLLLALRDFLVKDFLDEKIGGDESLYGFASLGPSVKIAGEDGAFELLSVGHEMPERLGYYGRHNEDEEILLLAKDKIFDLFGLTEKMAHELLKKYEQSEEKKTPEDDYEQIRMSFEGDKTLQEPPASDLSMSLKNASVPSENEELKV